MKKATIILAAAALALLALAPSASAFGVTTFGGSSLTPAGAPELAAGGHPDLTVTVGLEEEPRPEGGVQPAGNVRDIKVKLPAGFVGYPTAAPTCKVSELEVPVTGFYECSPESQVGILNITTYFSGFASNTEVPVYNMKTPEGIASQFGMNIGKNLVFINSGLVDDEGEYRIESVIPNIPQGLALGSSELTLWGVPADPSHDAQRYIVGAQHGGAVSNAPQVPLLRNPTSCSNTPSTISGEADSWQASGSFDHVAFDHDFAGRPILYGNCAAPPFSPQVSAQPTTNQADSPSGFDFTLQVPQNQNPAGRASSDLRAAEVTLPEGMTINPAGAGGLTSCSRAQVELGGNAPAQCPDGSKIGSVKIATPLLGHPLEGAVYLAHQGENKFGALLAAYITVNDPQSGTVLKLAGRIATDPKTGRLVASFDENPQLPFETLALEFFGGQRAPLTTPPACGTYTTNATLTPWSGNAPVQASSSFQITAGPNGSACPSGAFAPKLAVSSAKPQGGSYEPLNLQITRADGTARLAGLTVALPKGELARLAGIPYCPDAALAAVPTGEGTGAAQLATPSCPAASRVGSVSVGAGAGSDPFYVDTGSAYLAGPYKGAPLSLAIVTPAVAGPFDLGNVVVRTALQVDPETTQVTAVTDPLPTILDGIPLDLRDIRVALDREDFTLAPTSCRAQSFGGEAVSTGGAKASLSAAYGPVGCANLPFGPKIALSLKGARKRAGYPALTATVKAPAGDANIGRVSVALPHSEFLAQNHIGTVCTRPQFAAHQCPAASLYGHAEARTPLLAKPLKGPVYLRANGGARQLPDLVADLRGQIDVALVGYIDSVKGGIRTRFENVPDAPIQSFTLRMKGGKKSLLQNSADLCKQTSRARVTQRGQNGIVTHSAPALQVGCGKGKKK
jgi:hypothetical protein